MESGNSSNGKTQDKKKSKKRVLTAEELEKLRLDNVQPTSWNDEWNVTLKITANVLEDEDVQSVSTFETDSPKSKASAVDDGANTDREANDDDDNEEEATDDEDDDEDDDEEEETDDEDNDHSDDNNEAGDDDDEE